jgi:hypothetical protein
MQKPFAHPFTINVSAERHLRGAFSWTIRQHGTRARKQAQTAYATFEEARLAGKAVLDEMIANWECEVLSSAAA